MLVIDVQKDEDVIKKVQNVISDRGIKNAAIVSVIGAVKSCTISNMDAKDAGKDISHTYNEHLELSGSGEVTDGSIHIHCVASRMGEQTLAGHLVMAVVGEWFVRVYIMEF